MKNKENYKVIGLMSGTSLDGLDLACCEFKHTSGQWSFDLQSYETAPFPQHLHNKLKTGTALSAFELAELDIILGRWMGERTNEFIEKNGCKADLIASHGHTIFHQPEIGLTTQIGNGNMLSAITNLPVVYDFRSLDVALGGQGAPLVPIGDQLLFHEYDFCLNLGGIANISFTENNIRLAFDISPCNMALNYLAEEKGQKYDQNGEMARSGKLLPNLLREINSLEFYHLPAPKSLGYEWVVKHILKRLDNSSASIPDLMHTMVEHISFQIAQSIIEGGKNSGKLLVTGGGAFNDYLIERLQYHLPEKVQVHIPAEELINYKEALIFAFLGVLKVRSEVNCLASVTGASRDSCGGVLCGTFKE